MGSIRKNEYHFPVGILITRYSKNNPNKKGKPLNKIKYLLYECSLKSHIETK